MAEIEIEHSFMICIREAQCRTYSPNSVVNIVV